MRTYYEDKQYNQKKADLYERAIIKKVFHNKTIREQYLPLLLPQFFENLNRKAVLFALKSLYEKELPITLDNIVLYLQREDAGVKSFLKKNMIARPQEEDVADILLDPTVNVSDDLFKLAFEVLLVHTFGRFVDKQATEMLKDSAHREKSYEQKILAKARSINRVYNIIHGISEEKQDQLKEAQQIVNNNDEYITTCSSVLNGRIGGFTRGYVAALIAKSGHNKSTFVDYNSAHTILSRKVGSILTVTPEESAATRWRRLIAMTCKISTSMMRQKTVKILDEHIEKVRQLYNKKLIFIDDAFEYKDILEAMHYSKADMIILDHMQAIGYPGKGSYMEKMIGNIPALIDFQKRLAKERKIPILNLSQVNDKDIQRSDRLIKAPRYWDAYGSSVMYQASREFLSLWYPIKDIDDNNPIGVKHTINDVWITLEKSSFSALGKIKLYYEPEFARFSDVQSQIKKESKKDYIPPSEKTMELF